MPLEYKSQIGLEDIMPVLDEYVVWYGLLMKAYFEKTPMKDPAPAVFLDWLKAAHQERKISDSLADKARRIHEGMLQAAKDFAEKYDRHDIPPLKEYNEFNRYYEEFIQFMRRMEFDQALENSGFDDRTGLRSTKVMKDDIKRELDRRARRGNPFALALVKINNFNEAWARDEIGLRIMVRKISDQLKFSLRSFDDAYYLGDEYFFLCLKHADMMGSQAAISRINNGIASAHIPTPDDPLIEISVSTVISEPNQGDSIDELLVNMKKDLEGVDAKGAVIQYSDISPLQRYLHSIESVK